MSGVAQRAGQVDIGAAAAVSRWEGTGRADYASGISPGLSVVEVNEGARSSYVCTTQSFWSDSIFCCAVQRTYSLGFPLASARM
jgi:hypothetical protein